MRRLQEISKFRNVYGKVANREHCFDGIPITKNVHDNHFCAVNARFLAIVTESAGGGSFLVIPLEQTGRIEPNYPKVCGHQGNVLDIKWNPFIETVIASCSEDTSVRIWEIPEGGLKRNMTEAVLELYGHSRRVGLVEWHPTTNNILFSAGYDYKVSWGFPGVFFLVFRARLSCCNVQSVASVIPPGIKEGCCGQRWNDTWGRLPPKELLSPEGPWKTQVNASLWE
uniref:Coronin n=1 Tax=Nothoprocta perdicaria TaxID=30464 RepID=A0A8C6ZF76_NOTPE